MDKMTMKEYFLANGVVRYEMAMSQIVKYCFIGFAVGASCVLVWGIFRKI
jgi:hypothetical protein